MILKLQGRKYWEIQQQLNIKSQRQIYDWVKWYQTGQIYRFQIPVGYNKHHYSDYISPIHDPKMHLIKKTIQTRIAKNKKNHRDLYLKIIDEYQNQVALNQLLRWLNFNKSSYYRALKTMINPRPLTTTETTIYQICHQNPTHHPLLKNKLILGHRKVHYLLKQRGIQLNRKTVLRKMRQLNLLCQTPKNTVPVKKTLRFNNQ
ncbi:MAG: IS3 family transposase [Candidatus Phytoplasma pyri]